MLNRSYLICIFTVLVCLNLNKSLSQTKEVLLFDLKFTYKMSYIGDSTDLYSSRSENVILLVNDSLSLFETVNSNYLDSLVYISKGGVPKVSSKNFSYFRYKILKNNNTTLTYDDILPSRNEKFNEGFVYTETGDLDWKILEDTVRIGSFLCQKAMVDFGNRTWIAYFDSNVPISDGPYKFSGLPGLIVKISDTRSHWSFELVRVERGKNRFKATLEPVLSYKKSSKLDFFKSKRYVEANYFALHQADAQNFSELTSSKAKEMLIGAFKKRSNWIELLSK